MAEMHYVDLRKHQNNKTFLIRNLLIKESFENSKVQKFIKLFIKSYSCNNLSKTYLLHLLPRGVKYSTGESTLKSGPFLYCKYQGSIMSPMFLHNVNNIEHNLKQDVHTSIEVVSIIPP